MSLGSKIMNHMKWQAGSVKGTASSLAGATGERRLGVLSLLMGSMGSWKTESHITMTGSTPDPPTPTSQMLGLIAYTIMYSLMFQFLQ